MPPRSITCKIAPGIDGDDPSQRDLHGNDCSQARSRVRPGRSAPGPGLAYLSGLLKLLTPALSIGLPPQADRDASAAEERGQELGMAVQALQLREQLGPQLGRIPGREVGEPAVLGVLPDPLVRVRLGRVARER